MTDERKLELMQSAIKQAALSRAEDSRDHPRVGAVLADKEGRELVTAYRGERGTGDHAEFLLLEKAKERGIDPFGCILVVTLEPCTTRGPGKVPCATRIRESGIERVFIGMLDPNPPILGRGETILRWADIAVERFPGFLIKEIERDNARFIQRFKHAHLPESSRYVQTRITEVVTEEIRKSGFIIEGIPMDWDLTLEDVKEFCDAGAPESLRMRLGDILKNARAEAFDRKYENYTYEEDVRGLGLRWRNEIRDLLVSLDAAEYTRRRVIDVGIGNGLEAPRLLDSIRALTIVDIAERSLKRAARILPTARIVQSEAESLGDIESGSQDIYLSFRTYQSSLFDRGQAIREAHRVTRQGGIVLVSVSNGFLGRDGAFVPGHVLPRSSIVDRNRPFELAEEIRRKLSLFRFEGVGVRTGSGEIFIYGRRAR
ncbi:MAG: methyltransferase domain-containing protein [bacterium]|nr:methyltransferase domain-containing protein [bacterium]